MSARFVTTQWSQVIAARDGADTKADRALAALCEAYWYPLYAFLRSRGSGPDEARDLTQGYFAYLLEKDVLQSIDPEAGRFRSFLVASLNHFVANERRRQRARKRGGDMRAVSLDTGVAETRFRHEPTDRLTPEQLFERRWALTVLERAVRRLETEWADTDRGRQFQHLKAHLTGQEPRIPLRQIAVELGMTEVAVRGALHRLRQRFGQLIREEIAETVANPGDIDDEVRHLLAVVGPWEPARG